MTTPNGDKSRIVEHREGVVASSNPRGVKLTGQDAYANFSKYTVEPITPPRRGARVKLGLDADGFVRELQVLDDASPSLPTSSDRNRTITRLAVLKAASHFLGLLGQAHPDVKSEHVLVLADRWLAWVEQPDRD